MGEYTVGEAIDAAMARLREPPLVTVKDGFFVFRDPRLPGFDYDFRITSATDALEWVAHMAEKSWVTTEHLEQFARLALSELGEPRA